MSKDQGKSDSQERTEKRPEHEDSWPVAETGVGLSDDELYRALASTQRRRLLYILFVEEESTVEHLGTVLTGWETTETGTMAGRPERERVILELRHRHLPVLDETGLVTYDGRNQHVSIGSLDPAARDLICQSVETEGLSRS